MLEGLYSAAAGMAAQQDRMDSLANDVANVNTAGYKGLRVGFRDLIYQQSGRGSQTSVRTGTGAAAMTLGRSRAEGSLQQTGNPLDVAIQGQGFFQVRRPNGQVALTRNGNFRLDGTGRLVNQDGVLVQPAITVPRGTDESKVAIASDGTVTAQGGRRLGQISVVDVPSVDGLQPVGDNLYALTAASGGTRPAPRTTSLAQGTLEMSNVSMGDAMVDMMDAQRSFELASKAISMQDQILGIANGVKR
ncbi:MAG: flagellar hook-basal body protein [Thermoleophilaceae bacterium]